MQYSSKNFAEVPSQPNATGAQRLVHTDVRAKIAGEFSKERGHGVAIVDLPSKTMSMTLGLLEPKQKTRKHRHNYETILYVIRGRGYTMVENQKVPWQAGDAVYIPVWAWHNHVNLSPEPAEYLACENAPLLQNLGIALREEAPL